MAYATGSYTGLNNVADLFYAWALTNGWTQNYSASDGTGKRYHISKTIGSATRYFNFRTAVSEAISPWAAVSALLVNGSTAWTGSGTAWNQQVGFTTSAYGGSVAAMGGIEDIKASGGTYHFFATATTLTMVLETESTENDWRMITIGAVGDYTAYFASGGRDSGYLAGSADAQSAYCARKYSIGTDFQRNHCSLYIPTEGWYGMRDSWSPVSTRFMYNMVDSLASLDTDMEGSTTAQIVGYTPDSFRGNAQLAPSLATILKGITYEVWPMGEIEGVKFLNMTNYSNEEEITYGSDTYKLFRIFNSCPTGAAFLK